MDMPIGRTMPYNLEAEAAILGNIILDEKALVTAMDKLDEECFYATANKTLFNAISALFEEGVPVDIVTLSEKLGDKLDSVGGIAYITKIAQNVFTKENLDQYIEIARDKKTVRRLIEAASEILDMGMKDELSAGDIIDKSEQLIFRISEQQGTKSFSHIGEVVKSTLAILDERKKRGGKITGIRTGFTGLDAATAGLQNSNLIILAARPGVGKTSFALNIAQNAAIRENVPVAIFSLEMSKDELVNRVLSSEALVESGKLRVGDIDAADMTKIAHSLKDIITAPVYIDDTPGITVAEIRAKCRRLKMERGIGLVVIDYLQLMQGSSKSRGESRTQEVSEMSRSLKVMAKELNVPVITLSQLNRSSEKLARRPMLSDLRESGSIEQDADIVIMLSRPIADENSEESAGNIVECILAKNRAGECGVFNLAWRGEYTKFMNLDSRS